MKIKAYWDLLRLEHGIMYGIGVIIGIFVSDSSYFNIQNIVLGFFTALFLQASAFALNDYFDFEVDLANNRFDRPLVRGEISKKEALIASLILAPIGSLFAYLISFIAFTLAIFITTIGYIYDIKLKEYGLAGNFYIALSMAVPFLFGSVIAKSTFTLQAVILALISFLSGVGREIMKGIEDVEGDAIRNVKTIARMRGIKSAAFHASILFIASIVLSFIPFMLLKEYYLDFKYLFPIALTDAIFLKIAIELIKLDESKVKQKIRNFRKQTLMAMSLGLVGFLLGAF